MPRNKTRTYNLLFSKVDSQKAEQILGYAGSNYNQKQFGPVYWSFYHTLPSLIVHILEKKRPNMDEVNEVFDYTLQLLTNNVLLPCYKCRDEWKSLLHDPTTNPLHQKLRSEYSTLHQMVGKLTLENAAFYASLLNKWIYDAHNLVNMRLELMRLGIYDGNNINHPMKYQFDDLLKRQALNDGIVISNDDIYHLLSFAAVRVSDELSFTLFLKMMTLVRRIFRRRFGNTLPKMLIYTLNRRLETLGSFQKEGISPELLQSKKFKRFIKRYLKKSDGLNTDNIDKSNYYYNMRFVVISLLIKYILYSENDIFHTLDTSIIKN